MLTDLARLSKIFCESDAALKISKIEQLHFHPKFQAEMVLVTFAETKVTPTAGEQFKDIVKFSPLRQKSREATNLSTFKIF